MSGEHDGELGVSKTSTEVEVDESVSGDDVGDDCHSTNPRESDEQDIESGDDADKTIEPLLEAQHDNPNDGDRGKGNEYNASASDDGVRAETDVFDSPTGRNRRAECLSYMRTPGFIIYSSQALSAWGDRMWKFAVGLYLVAIEVDSLRLAAIYGLCLGMSSLMFGALIGGWIDRNPRLRVVRLSLLIQNSTIIVCAVILGVLLFWESDISAIWDGGLTYILQGFIIIFGCLANLASIANHISIQKDWVVVVAGKNKETLANINATIRRIDLVINIVAPIVVGQIMTFASMFAGTVFIASWNLVSGFAEYYLLVMVYKRVPALAVKKSNTSKENVSKEESDDTEFKEIDLKDDAIDDKPEVRSEEKETKCVNQMCGVFINLVDGWKVYMNYQVHYAGLGLAFLYMTVLGFSSITSGYAYSQGVPEWLIGVFRGVGSISGILGTLLYPFLRNKIGLERTGLWAISEEIICLVLCVLSIWAPGSPFDLQYSSKIPEKDNGMSFTTPVLNISNMAAFNDSLAVTYKPLSDGIILVTKIAGEGVNVTSTMSTIDTGQPGDETQAYASIALFFTGIICARLGLWCFDLVVTQLLQENVLESQRGVVNGVQSSLNSLMDMFHFILVIFLPRPETFGILIILSFIFVFSGGVLYSIYCYKVRGHVMPFHNIKDCQNNTKERNGSIHGEKVDSVA